MKIQLFIPGLENQGKNEDLKECFLVPAVRSISSRRSGIKSKAKAYSPAFHISFPGKDGR